MTTVISRPPQSVLFENVSWADYGRALRQRDARHEHTRITYDNGRMELVTKGFQHEQIKTTIGRLLETYSLEAGIPITGLGEATCRLKELRKGLEADECYYVASPPPASSPDPEKELDLTRYPPPDLAIEVDITRQSIPRQPIYAALKIREIWRYRRDSLSVLLLTAKGAYQPAEQSLAFPDLPIKQFNRFLKIALTQSQYEAAKAIRDWARQSKP